MQIIKFNLHIGQQIHTVKQFWHCFLKLAVIPFLFLLQDTVNIKHYHLHSKYIIFSTPMQYQISNYVYLYKLMHWIT
jgi:hypothetical protein